MQKIPGFTVNHLKLNPGVYVSRKDAVGNEVLTTFDIRMKAPNREIVMSTGTCHAIEHMGATFLRNDPEYADKTIYWGPMGCRTGFYAILKGDLSPMDIQKLLIRLFRAMASFEGVIPGASPKDCGNFEDMDLFSAKIESQCFVDNVLTILSEDNTVYPV